MSRIQTSWRANSASRACLRWLRYLRYLRYRRYRRWRRYRAEAVERDGFSRRTRGPDCWRVGCWSR